MKKIYIPIFVFALFALLVIPPALAQEDASSTDIGVRAQAQQRASYGTDVESKLRANIQIEAQAQQGEESREAKAQNRDRETYHARVRAHVYTRFLAAIERLEILIDRVESRMSTLADTGIDVTAATPHLTAASEAVAQAKIDFENLQALFETNIDAEVDLKALRTEAKEAARAAIASLKEAKTELRLALSELKEAIRVYNSTEVEVESETEVETETD